MMRLVIISTELSPGPGGIGVHAHQLATAVRATGWEVTVVAPQDYVTAEEVDRFNRQATYEVVAVDRRGSPPRRAAHRFRVTRDLLDRAAPDVVLATGERSVWLAALLLGNRVPWVAFGHGAEFGTRVKWRRAATRTALARSAAVVCNSEYTRTALMRLGARPPRTEVISPGADVDAFARDPAAGTAFRDEHALGAHRLVVTVGNITRRKGQDLVVRSLTDPRLADLHYAVVGLPTTADRLVALASDLGVADRVHVLGALPGSALRGAYNAADVFAMTSRHDDAGDFEGYGISVIEAALCGRPAVVTSGSGLTEAVADGETGLVVEYEHPGAIADALADLLHDDARRESLGRDAEHRARLQNDWSRLIERFVPILEGAARGRVDVPGVQLAVVSDTPYYTLRSQIVGWGPTVRELDHLAGRFARITHVAPLYHGDAPRSALPHRAESVELTPVEPAGGSRLRSKLGVVARYPTYLYAIRTALRDADAVHVRCPSNISLLALAVLAAGRSMPPAWIKFGGNWRPDGPEPWSYRLQRLWLRRGIAGAAVTVNGRWSGDPAHVIPFHNPTLDDDDLGAGAIAASTKELQAPYQLAYVGRLDRAKGAGRALSIAIAVRDLGLPVQLHVVGDGPEGTSMQRRTEQAGMADAVSFYGWLPRPEVETVYAQSHFLVLPTDSEGFPKVLAEAMAFGAVPLAGAVSSIPSILGEIGSGVALSPADTDGFAAAVAGYVKRPEDWRRDRDRGLAGAAMFSYESYLRDVEELFDQQLGLAL